MKLAFVSALVLGASWFAAADPAYHVSYLGFGFSNGITAKLNNQGVIVGNIGTQGFVYKKGQMTNLPTFGGAGGTLPDAINDSGVIGGYSATTTQGRHAFTWDGVQMTDLNALPGFPSSTALGINSNGVVVGVSSTTDNSSSHAFRYDSGVLTDLGSGSANAINSSGLVVGTSSGNRAVIYQNGSLTDLGNFGDSPLTSAIDVNDAGQIAGMGFVRNATGFFANHAFLYDQGVWHDLGLPAGLPLAIPSALNNLGQMVGNSNGGLGADTRQPFLYTGGTIYNLQNLLDSSGAGLTLELAYDINDSGVILAEGSSNAAPYTGYQAVWLTPVPEPAGAACVPVLVAVIVGQRWRRVCQA